MILSELLYVGYQFSQKVYKRTRKLPKVKAYYQKVEMQVTYHEMSGLSFLSRTQSMATQPDEVQRYESTQNGLIEKQPLMQDDEWERM